MMCRTCRREGTKLIFLTSDPDEKPITIEAMPPISPITLECIEILNQIHYLKVKQRMERMLEQNLQSFKSDPWTDAHYANLGVSG